MLLSLRSNPQAMSSYIQNCDSIMNIKWDYGYYQPWSNNE